MWGSSNTQKPQGPVQITVRDLDAEQLDGTSASSPLSMGSLLRLFRSEFFDAFMAVTYLYRYRDSGGVHDYLCNQLYGLDDADLETFMPQVCNLLVHHARQSPALERFVMDKCADSMHIALQVFWFLQASVEDAARRPDSKTATRVRVLRSRCETAAVNGSKHIMLAAAAERVSAATLVASEPPFSPRARQLPESLFHSSSADDLAGKDVQSGDVRNEQADESVLFIPSPEHNGHDVRSLHSASSNSDSEYNQETYLRTKGRSKKNECTMIEKDHSTLRPLPCQEGRPVSAWHDSKASSAILQRMTNSTKHTDGPQKPVQVTNSNSSANTGSSSDESGSASERTDPSLQTGSLMPNLEEDFDPLALLAMKQERCDYFNDSVSIAKAFVRLSLTTRALPPDQRMAHLSKGLKDINDMLLRRMKGEPGEPLLGGSPAPLASEVAKLGRAGALRSVHLPLTRASSQALRIVRVHSEEVVILTSRTRAPFMVNIEVLPTNMQCADKLLFCEHRVIRPEGTSEKIRDGVSDDEESGLAFESRNANSVFLGSNSSLRKSSGRRLSEMTPAERQRANVRKAVYGDPYTVQCEVFAEAEMRAATENEDSESAEYKSRQAVILGVYGELWSWKEERILSKSPFRNLKGTRLMPFIVKAGDDLRQEQLAIQLIRQFEKIFVDEEVDVYLKPFTVMSVSSEAGFVEVIKDAVSVHSLKKRTPNFVSLLDYFERAFGKLGTDRFRAAQRRFIRSMAGYSLVTYFLQIKDRHNGNIMVDASGRVIHIDFGFMLTNSPGAIKFENVPFKLTEEYLQVICARRNVQDSGETCKTEGYRYFQELFVLGLLAARKHYEKITTLVEIMTEGTTMPCMMSGLASGQGIVEALRSRFAVGMPEEHCISYALGLIEESRLSWRSASYDRFQAYSNGYR